ncbi:LOW QUALITY PROTEIN: cation channel sperm-associated auxiliary subunit gamma [Pelodiscus sinensis]|uniref:LOW QUALITY PROTEIN: cation channel sperm-associated auxiliary subunit gamma n=1 Tax=Pelodiscus sinensis TaxID=13735 RepID=UPI003F6C78B5
MQNMQHLFALLILWHIPVCLLLKDCEWKVELNEFDNLGGDKAVFFRQHPVTSVAAVFQNLTDSAIDLNDRNSHYLGFPYYLKINLTCTTQDAAMLIRKAHLTGLRPIVTVTFQEPVNIGHWKPEQLQIEMKAAPYQLQGPCGSQELCRMCWYTPMPMTNWSVVMKVLVRSNGLGLQVDSKRFSVNINGYVKETESGVQYSVGRKVSTLRNLMLLRSPSRPIWATFNHAPVLLLGGFSAYKIVLVSDSEFADFTFLEVGVDNCWIGSLNCPVSVFSSAISDTIATEQMLFVRQNQLIYSLAGNYATLSPRPPGTAAWTRVLPNMCVSKLNPVFFPHNDSEYVMALGSGSEEGVVFLGTIRDGAVQFSELRTAERETVCMCLKIACSVLWAVYITEENLIVLLVQERQRDQSLYHIVGYDRDKATFQVLFRLPRFVPKDTEKGFVMLLGLEEYTDSALVPRGLSYNPFSGIFYIWGNVILQSYDLVNYIHLSDFPRRSHINYFILSYVGEFVCVTQSEEIWFAVEGSSAISRLYPSEAWSVYLSLQLMSGSKDFGFNETFVSLFFNEDGLQQLVYIRDGDKEKEGKLIKRNFPVHYILTYQQLIYSQYRSVYFNDVHYIKFFQSCSFSTMRFKDLPAPQRFTRMEHYRTEPPDVMDPTGFHSNRSLAVYQGLIFQLLWLHADYSRPYADPVHDPTWRWWKNRKQYAEYYFYVASNGNSSGGVFVNMESDVKIYDLQANNQLPERFTWTRTYYSFSVFLSIELSAESLEETPEDNSLDFVWLTIVLGHPEYVVSHLRRRNLVSRGSVLYQVTIRDTGKYPEQGLSGKNLLRSSMILKVINAPTQCYHYTASGPQLQGYAMVPLFIGCPPGKRLAFDITRTLRHTAKENKHYFDCLHKNPDMPCFFFDDVFYPFFLIQDMVTGDSGPFTGRYTLKVIGGGPYSESQIQLYSPGEILNYNTENSSTLLSLIWRRADRTRRPPTDPKGFTIFSSRKSGIKWVCEQNSPCHDVTPLDMRAPDFFFLVKVSNRAVDENTYCDYDLEFVIHVHGLRLSPSRAIVFMKISLAVLSAIVSVYILCQVLGPPVWACFTRLLQWVEETLAVRTESTATFASFSSHNHSTMRSASSL